MKVSVAVLKMNIELKMNDSQTLILQHLLNSLWISLLGTMRRLFIEISNDRCIPCIVIFQDNIMKNRNSLREGLRPRLY